MIHEVDEGIRRLLAAHGLPGNDGALAFDAPTREWTAARNAPTVNVFLYDIREDLTRRRSGAIEEHDGDGMVVAWHEPPRWFGLSYLVTAWTSRPQDEHRLLADVLACLTRTRAFAPQWLTGSLAELGLTVPLAAAGPVSEGRAASDVWSALGGQLKPAIDLLVTAPLVSERATAGQPVTDGLVVRAGTRQPGTAERERRLRYPGTAGADHDGFAAPRPRPLPAARRPRRHRGGTP